MAKIAALTIYPIKSLGGISAERISFTPQGFKNDRIFMLIDERGNMVTLRDYPRLGTVRMRERPYGFVADVPRFGMQVVPFEEPHKGDCEEVEVSIHGQRSSMVLLGREYDAFFSSMVTKPVRLVRSVPWLVRERHSNQMGISLPLHAQDGYPLMMLSEASVQELNHRLDGNGKTKVGIERFRPNIVLSEASAHEEDQLEVAWMGSEEYEFLRPKLCSRCRAITVEVNPASMHFGTFDPKNEPMRTLISYRQAYKSRRDPKVYFGVNVVPKESGTLAIGMDVVL